MTVTSNDLAREHDELRQPRRPDFIGPSEAVQRSVALVETSGPGEPSAQAARRAAQARLEDDIRREGFRRHFARFPEDVPDLADVAKLCVSDTDHPAAAHPDLVDEVAAWLERQHPAWATSGDVDATIEAVLLHVALLAEGGSR